MDNSRKNFEAWWDEKDQVVRTKVIGSQTDVEEAKNFAEEIVALARELKNRGIKYVDSLNDVTGAGISVNPNVRKIYVDVLKQENFENSRAAMFGMKSNYYRTILNILLRFSGIGGIKFFKKESDAFDWIKNEREKRSRPINESTKKTDK